MNVGQFCVICEELEYVTKDFPFDEQTLVFRVGEKIFAITDLEEYPSRANLKCDPERSIELREQYEDVIPGYHMNKKHWNTITLAGDVPDTMIAELIRHSYDLVYQGLPKKVLRELTSA